MNQACRRILLLSSSGLASSQSRHIVVDQYQSRILATAQNYYYTNVTTSSLWHSVVCPLYQIYDRSIIRFKSTVSSTPDRSTNPNSSAPESEKEAKQNGHSSHNVHECAGFTVDENTGKEIPSSQEAVADEPVKLTEEAKDSLLNAIATLDASIVEKDMQLLELKQRAVAAKVELDNVRLRLQRESESTKKFAIQGFVKNLLDVGDNLRRAISSVPDHVRSSLVCDDLETTQLLKEHLEGLMVTEEELLKVFKKFGVEKFDPLGQQFDPNSHLALFEIPDPNKEPGTVGAVIKTGYMLHDRVLRPAEVGVVKRLE